jgi:amino acid transporter
MTSTRYIGFDSISSLSAEVKNPNKTLPRGIVSTLAIVTTLYVGVSLTITGMVPYLNLDKGAPLAKAFEQVGLPKVSVAISFGTKDHTFVTSCSVCNNDHCNADIRTYWTTKDLLSDGKRWTSSSYIYKVKQEWCAT